MVSDKKKQYHKNWLKNNPKKVAISRWKTQGLNDDYEMVWDRFNNSTNCENPKCNVVYGKYGDGEGIHKCMDHDHTPGLENNFRSILCAKCNVVLERNNNTSGTPFIYKDNERDGWYYQKVRLGKKHQKRFKSYYETIIYKWLYEDGYTLE